MNIISKQYYKSWFYNKIVVGISYWFNIKKFIRLQTMQDNQSNTLKQCSKCFTMKNIENGDVCERCNQSSWEDTDFCSDKLSNKYKKMFSNQIQKAYQEGYDEGAIEATNACNKAIEENNTCSK